MSKEIAIKVITIKKTAIKFREKQKKNKKKDLTDNELENWYKDVLGIVENLITERAGDKEYLELEKFKSVMPEDLIFGRHIDLIRRYLNKLLNCFDIFYPKLFKRYFNETYDIWKFTEISERIIK